MFKRSSSATLLALSLLLLPFAVSAQLGGAGTQITFSPTYPSPDSEYTARVEAYSYDLSRSSIQWVVDGVAREDALNSQTILVTAPALGESQSISARVTEQGGTSHTASRTLVPGTIDLVVEGDTRVPHFYEGRALPSAGSPFRVVASPTLYTPGGARVASGDLIYTWRVDKKVARNGRGQNVLQADMPRTGNVLIELSVSSVDGSTEYATFTRISPTQPVNVFYEDNPLYGLAQSALPKEFTLLQNEISLRAEPYFIAHALEESAQYEWRVDNQKVANPNTDPTTLTLRKAGGAGDARVSFTMRNLSALRQAASGDFVIYFGQ